VMEKGLSKDWTPEMEGHFQRLLNARLSFADRYRITSVRDTLKYDGRSKEWKRARGKLQLMLAVASDDDLTEVADSLHGHPEYPLGRSPDETLENLIQLREEIRARGISRELVGSG